MLMRYIVLNVRAVGFCLWLHKTRNGRKNDSWKVSKWQDPTTITMFSSFIFSKKHFWSLKSHVYINEHNGFVDCFANDENNDDDDKDNVVVFPRFITQDTVHF